jgi:diguanylate cyclase (GGDEF)-like protein
VSVEEANQQLIEVLAEAQDVIARQSAELAEARRTAREDELTKLPNRRAFNERFDELSAAYRRHQRTFCLLMIDLDNFKQINDRYGHDAGDAILELTALVLREASRRGDHLFRIGGEEFAILAPDTSLEGATKQAERIRRRIERATLRHRSETIRFTCSIGVAQGGPKHVGTSLLRVADALLYAAKKTGRNNVKSLGQTDCGPASGAPTKDGAVAASTMSPSSRFP